MKKRPDDTLAAALLLTQRMKTLADDASWDELASLESEQSTMLRACFEPTPLFDNRQEAERVVGQIMQLNHEILQLGQEAHQVVRDELQSINKGRNAAKAYLDCPE